MWAANVAELTASNRSVYAPPPVRRLRGSIRLGRLRLPRLIPPTFGRAVFATQSPFMPAQTSYTAGTLCAIPPKAAFNVYGKKFKKYVGILK
jgi:hypothetical protein